MSEVRVLMMQRDEGDTLARWLGHYGGLFGYENLHIFDNGSQDRFTLELLREAESNGSRLYRGFDTQHDFQNKGGHFGNIIRHLDNSERYDFALPLDCDEILAVFTEAGLSTDHAAILAEIDTLKGETASLRLDMSMFNVPERPGWFAPDRHFVKGFLPANSIDILDNGQHEPKSRLKQGHVRTRLTYLHYHNRPFEVARALARKKLSDLVDVDDRKALRAYAKVPGAPGTHLIRTLFMSRADYVHRYEQEVQVFVPPGGASNLLLEHGKTMVWDAEAYLDRNPDVRRYELTALHHYLKHGFIEGRKLRTNAASSELVPSSCATPRSAGDNAHA